MKKSVVMSFFVCVFLFGILFFISPFLDFNKNYISEVNPVVSLVDSRFIVSSVSMPSPRNVRDGVDSISPLLYYPFDNNADEQNNKANGVIKNPVLGESLFNNSYFFNGINDQILFGEIKNNQELNFSKKNVSIGMWFKDNDKSAKNEYLFSQYQTTNKNILVMLGYWNLFMCVGYDDFSNSIVSPKITLSPNRWYYLNCVFESGEQGMRACSYVDGSLIGCSNYNPLFLSLSSSSTSTKIGCSGNSNQCWGAINGSIDELKIWDLALNSSQINSEYLTYRDFLNNQEDLGDLEDLEDLGDLEDLEDLEDGVLGDEDNLLGICEDSDEGKNYFIKGFSFNDLDNEFEDGCFEFNSTNSNYYSVENGSYVLEYFCNKDNLESVYYKCNNGCSDGACNKEPITSDLANTTFSNQSNLVNDNLCMDLIFNLNSATSLFLEGEYSLINQSSYISNIAYQNKKIDLEVTKSSWSSLEDYTYLDTQVFYFKDNFNAGFFLNEYIPNNSCINDSYINEFGEEYSMFVCNWNPTIFGRNSINEGSFSGDFIWASGNKIVLNYFYKGPELTSEQLSKIYNRNIYDLIFSSNDSFIEKNNQGYIEVPLAFAYLLEENLFLCSPGDFSENWVFPSDSNLTNSECTPSWNCKVEPPICPDFGKQQKICIDTSCGLPEVREDVFCASEICSGCFIPSFIGGIENTCIGYGDRREFWLSNNVKINEGNHKDILFKINSENNVSISLLNQKSSNSINLVKSNEEDFEVFGWAGIIKKVKLKLNSVDNVKKSAIINVDLNPNKPFADTLNLYCNEKGIIQGQKSRGSYCKFDYECESNHCDNKKCSSLSNVVREKKGVKFFSIAIICKVKSSLKIEKYNQCLLDSIKDSEDIEI